MRHAVGRARPAYLQLVTQRPDLTVIASAIGERARGRILGALMGGQALTATELAREARIAPSTASGHLACLRRAGLVSVTAQGRHRYVRIAGPLIGEVLEDLMGIVRSTAVRGPRDATLRRARVCYDHLAGAAGVRLFDTLHERGWLRGGAATLELTPEGAAGLGALGIGVEDLQRRRRALVRCCLDWSERRDHLGGAVGAAVLGWMFERRLAGRDPATRVVTVSSRGEGFLATLELARSPAPRLNEGRSRRVARDGG